MKKSNFVIEVLIGIFFLMGFLSFFFETNENQKNIEINCNYFFKTTKLFREDILNADLTSSENLEDYISFLQKGYKNFELKVFEKDLNKTFSECSENYKTKIFCHDFVSSSLDETDEIIFKKIDFGMCRK